MKYTCLLFDADNTLLDFSAAERKAFQETCHTAGILCSDEGYRQYSHINDGLWKMLEQGAVTAEKLKVERFRLWLDWHRQKFPDRPLPDTITPERMRDAYVTALGKQADLMPDAEEVCRTLYARYPHMYVITNGIGEIQRSRFAKTPIRQYFRDLFISGEIGYAKPDTRFFDAVLAKTGVTDKHTVLVIGDSLTSDMAGAIASGLDCCYLSPNGTAPDLPVTYTIRGLAELCTLL